MERCSRCVLPVRLVPLDKEGVCPLCRADDGKIRYHGEDSLVAKLEDHRQRARGQGARHDCLVTISGGKDSTYVLHQLVRKYQLKPLAFYYRAFFAVEDAWQNVDRAVKALGVDLVVSTDDRFQRRYVRRNLLGLPRQPRRHLGRLAPILCTGCREGYSEKAHRLARQRGLSLIVGGGGAIEADLRYFWRPGAYARKRKFYLALAWQEFKEFLSCPILRDPLCPRNTRFLMPMFGSLLRRALGMRRKGPRGIESIGFFDYVPWEPGHVVDVLERDLGWRRPRGRSTTVRFDCKLHLLLDGLRIRYLGISEKEVMFSMMIRKNLMTRDEALEKLQTELSEEEAFVEPALRDVLQALNAEDQFDTVCSLWQTPAPGENGAPPSLG